MNFIKYQESAMTLCITNEPSDSLTNKYTKRRKERHGTAYWCKKLLYSHGLPSIIVYILFWELPYERESSSEKGSHTQRTSIVVYLQKKNILCKYEKEETLRKVAFGENVCKMVTKLYTYSITWHINHYTWSRI